MVASLATFFPPQDVSAADIKKTACIGYDSVAYTSPFSKTSNMCLGQGQTYQYYQFVVKFNSKVSDASVSGKSGSGTTINFVKQDDTTYVSKAGTEFENMGYAAPKSTSTSTCNNKDKIYSIAITAKGNGETHAFDNINLCNYVKAEQSLVPELVAEKIPGDNGAVSKNGSIYGNLGIFRENELVPENWKRGPLEQDGIISIKLSGTTKLEATGPAKWYKLTNGRLTIPSIEAGTYKLDIVYNDAIILQGLGGDAGWTNGNMKLSYPSILVPPGGDVWIGGSTSGTIKYLNAEGVAVDTPKTEADDRTSCVIQGVGWIICPVVTFMSGIVDGAYTFVSGLLVVQPLFTTGKTEGLYNAWSVMRNIANVAFVISFLIIIFSQLTSMGVSNYGVKKLLPRLVIAAILVNVSYWVCAIAVDLSNIIGASMVSVFHGIAGSIPDAANATSTLNTGEGWLGIAGKVLAGVGVVGILYYVEIAALLPALIAALAAIVTVFLVLTLRQALIILLIVVSPLAFVAFLLPNTEDLFTKWRKLLVTLLLMYPIIAGLFGVSALASTIIMGSSPDMVVQIMGALVSILPLALTPIVMKSAGGVLNRFGGMVNNPNKGPFDRMRKGAESIKKDRDNLRNTRALRGDRQFGRGAVVRFGARRRGITAGREGEANRANAEYIAGEATTNASYRNAAAGGTLASQASVAATTRVQSSAISALDKMKVDEINAAGVVLKDAKMDQAQMRSLSQGLSVPDTTDPVTGAVKQGITVSPAMQQAAIRSVVANNDVKGMGELWDQSRTWRAEDGGDDLRSTLADSMQASLSRPAYFGQGAIAALRLNTHNDSNKTVVEAIKANAYSPSKLASADKDELNVVATVAATSTDPTLTIDHRKQLTDNAHTALTDPELASVVSKNKDHITNIQDGDMPRVPLS